MRNPFKTVGFDSIIGPGTLVSGSIVNAGSLVIEGDFNGDQISYLGEGAKSEVTVAGTVDARRVVAHDLTVLGRMHVADEIRVEGTLAVKGDAKIVAGTIYYRTLVIEPGAVILANMKHLDHVSEGEEV